MNKLRALSACSGYHVHHASVCENVVIGVLVVLCELLVIVRVVVHAVGGLMLVLIALHVVLVFVVAIFRMFSVFGSIVFTPPVGDSRLLLAVTEFWTVILYRNLEKHSTDNWSKHLYLRFP